MSRISFPNGNGFARLARLGGFLKSVFGKARPSREHDDAVLGGDLSQDHRPDNAAVHQVFIDDKLLYALKTINDAAVDAAAQNRSSIKVLRSGKIEGFEQSVPVDDFNVLFEALKIECGEDCLISLYGDCISVVWDEE